MTASCRDTAAEATRFHLIARADPRVGGSGVAVFGSRDRLPEFATRSFVLLLGLSGAVCGRRTANSVGRVNSTSYR